MVSCIALGPAQRQSNTYLADSDWSSASWATKHWRAAIDTIEKHSRLPRKYDQTEPAKVQRKPLKPNALHKLTGQDPKKILLRYLSKERTQDIAESYGVTSQALSQWLIRNAEADWKDAQVARAIARKEEAEDNMEAATNPLDLAKARELLKAAQWDLERVCKRIYGEDKTSAPLETPKLVILMANLESRIIDQAQITHQDSPGNTENTSGAPAMLNIGVAHARG